MCLLIDTSNPLVVNRLIAERLSPPTFRGFQWHQQEQTYRDTLALIIAAALRVSLTLGPLQIHGATISGVGIYDDWLL